jgi:hypothetical protein
MSAKSPYRIAVEKQTAPVHMFSIDLLDAVCAHPSPHNQDQFSF